MHVFEEVRKNGIQSTCEEVGVGWETRKDKEEYMDMGTDGFLHVE